MEFCSKFGYDYGYDGSSSEELELDETIKTKIRKADTNIVSISFDKLINTSEMFAGEPIRCQKCEAIMSQLSRAHVKYSEKIWYCEFCLEPNELSISDFDQIPDDMDTKFLLESAPGQSNNSKKIFPENNTYLLYCIDISASMDSEFSKSNGISRLDAVKNACVNNLKNLKNSQPDKRVGLVTFSNHVNYFGDSFNPQKSLTIQNSRQNSNISYNLIRQLKTSLSVNTQQLSSILDNKEKLIELGQKQDKLLKPIEESLGFLESKIKSLVSEGVTALGPALTFSIGFLDQLPGSQIILCTDGAANVGVGSITRNNNSENFYEEIADYAKSKGIMVNVITMQGTECKLAMLGRVADRTNGSVSIVRPSELSQEFNTIIQNKTIATDVIAKLIVSKYLYIRDENLELTEFEANQKEDKDSLKLLNKGKKSTLVKQIGNVNADTEINFEYGVKRLNKEEEKDRKRLGNLPFQIQISYKLPNGARAMRVITKSQEFTTDRQKVEGKLNSKEILWSNYSQKMSNYVTKSSFNAAKKSIKQIKSFEKRTNLSAPTEMQTNLKLISNLANKNVKADQLTDEQIKCVLKVKKSNRASFMK